MLSAIIPTSDSQLYSPTMPGKRKSREFYHEEVVIVEKVLEKYPAIKELFSGDTGLLKTPIRVPDEMYHSLSVGNNKK